MLAALAAKVCHPLATQETTVSFRWLNVRVAKEFYSNARHSTRKMNPAALRKFKKAMEKLNLPDRKGR